jgi:hypothetical protein
MPLSTFMFLVDIFYIASISITFAFPIITLVIYYIKTKGGNKKFKETKNAPEFIEEVN